MTAVFICLDFFILSRSLFVAIWDENALVLVLWVSCLDIFLFNHNKEARVILEMDFYELNPRVS